MSVTMSMPYVIVQRAGLCPGHSARHRVWEGIQSFVATMLRRIPPQTMSVRQFLASVAPAPSVLVPAFLATLLSKPSASRPAVCCDPCPRVFRSARRTDVRLGQRICMSCRTLLVHVLSVGCVPVALSHVRVCLCVWRCRT